METFFSIATNPILGIIAAIIILLSSLIWVSKNSTVPVNKKKQKKKPVPEAAGAWPIIGHLHLLRPSQPPAHLVLAKLADQHGPIFTIKLGVHTNLVISNWEMAKECFTTHDRALAGRPKNLASELLGYGGSMIVFIPYGSHWRQIRKVVTLELLSSHRIEMLKDVMEAEVRASVKAMYNFWENNKKDHGHANGKVLVEMKRWFGDVTLNVILKLIYGKSMEYYYAVEEGGGGRDDQVRWKKALREFFDLWGRFVLADAVPFLRGLDVGGHEKAMNKIAKEMDVVIEGWLKEHKERRRSASDSAGAPMEREDFMDLMLRILDDDDDVARGHDYDTVNKATCQALTLAASDTTAVTLTWAISLLVNNPDAIRKIQAELHNHVGTERQVNESDLKNLHYLKAVIKETLRLYPAAPLSASHEAREDITIGDCYHVPAGTRLLTNLYKIQRDPRVWENPCEFRPERFLTRHREVDVRGQNFEFMPFGSGRRMCPGISFALLAVELNLANFLHGFDFETPFGEAVDMTETFGITNLRATPLNVLISPRLPSHLYGPPERMK